MCDSIICNILKEDSWCLTMVTRDSLRRNHQGTFSIIPPLPFGTCTVFSVIFPISISSLLVIESLSWHLCKHTTQRLVHTFVLILNTKLWKRSRDKLAQLVPNVSLELFFRPNILQIVFQHLKGLWPECKILLED